MKYILLLLVLASFYGISVAQINCTDYTMTSTTTEIFSSPGTGCPVAPVPVGNTAWTGFGAGGFITHTFPTPQTSVNIIYAHINTDDYGTMSVNGGGTISVSLVNGCVDVVGNVVGPYTGPGSYGAVEINVSSTAPFTTVTLTNNFSTSGFVSGCTPIAAGPSVYLGPDTTLCIGATLVLDATTAGCTYLWQDNSTNPTYTVTQAGTYWVQITDGGGLTASDTIVVDYFGTPTVNIGNDTTICPGQTVLLDATNPGWTYLWQDGSSNPTYVADTAGIYSVQITDQCGQTATDQVEVSLFDIPYIDLGPDQTICEEENYLISPYTNGTSYLWSDGSTNPTLMIDTSGIYWCQATNNCGFVADTIEIFIENCDVILEMPNVFTPNVDGANDAFVPVKTKGIETAHMTILNRWGNVIFETDDLSTGWDGTANGDECTNGVYFYLVEYIGMGQEYQAHGFVTLVRE